MSKKYTTEQINNIVLEWFNLKTKLYKEDDFHILLKYVKSNTTDEQVQTIEFSSDFVFNYFNLSPEYCEKIKVRPENIFKLNLFVIVYKFNKYFPCIETNLETYFYSNSNSNSNSNALIEIAFEGSGLIDLEMKKKKCTYKHDVYIKISNENEEFYDIGLEYFETIHSRIKDYEKEISSKVNLSAYYVYKEGTDDYVEYMKNTVYSIFLGKCTLEDNPYTLSKIIYFKNYNKNNKKRSLQTDTELFNNIINWEKTDVVDFKLFFEDLRLVNQETEELFEYDEFIEYLDDNYDIQINFLDEKQIYCNYENIIILLMKINNIYSVKIESYKLMYAKAMSVLKESQKELIFWVKESINTKRLIPKYIDSYLYNHLINHKDPFALKKVYYELEHHKSIKKK